MLPISFPERPRRPRTVMITSSLLRVVWSVVVVTASIFGCIPDQPAEDPTVVSTVEDLSGFQHFVFYRAGGEGFCPPEGAVLRAELTRQPDGGVTLETWVLEAGSDPGIAGASGPAVELADLIGQRLPVRTLGPVEIDQMNEVFQSVTIGSLVWSVSEHGVTSECQLFDPCRLDYVQWDGRALSTDTPCHLANQVLSREQLDEIIDFIESLRAAPDEGA